MRLENKQQAVSVLAICASIILAGLIISYKPGAFLEIGDFRLPTGVPPALGSTGLTGYVTQGSSDIKTLSVSGNGVIYTKANQAMVTLGLYTEDKEASRAIEDNSRIMTQVISAIKKLGISEEDIKTVTYVVNPNYNWEIRQVVSYQVTNLIQIKIKGDLTKVGPIIDSATGAGANRVDGIGFGLTDDEAQKIKLEAYDGAIKDAKSKAERITSGLGIKIAGVQSVTESSYIPYVPSYRMDSSAGSGEKSSTPVLQGNLSVSVTLNILYLIEQAS